MRIDISGCYFRWLCDITELTGYSELLSLLHDTPFVYIIPMDKNRESDGLSLRWRFLCENSINRRAYFSQFSSNECSVLEMMIALALRMEEITGDCAENWFCIMLESLGLFNMTNECFDKNNAVIILENFLERKFRRNGKGSLFTVTKSRADMRATEIWYQMCLYLDEQF